MFGVVIWIFFAYLEEVLSIFTSLGYEGIGHGDERFKIKNERSEMQDAKI
jgi:hypothetical protein